MSRLSTTRPSSSRISGEFEVIEGLPSPVDLQRHVLVTGGAGYIGSHTCIELLQRGYEVSVIDNFSNSDRESLRRVANLTSSSVYLYSGDISDPDLLDRIFANHNVWAVIHFAALKSAPESVHKPLDYYRVNVGGTVNLLQCMQNRGVKRLVFSSTAAVYGTPQKGTNLITEDHPTAPANPYGRTKLVVEGLIQDVCTSTTDFGAVLLRYFNPVGAHESGAIGEAPTGAPGNLLPFVLQTAAGQRTHVDVTGIDWPTADGSGVRDFIHVCDLAKGHVAALTYADSLALPNEQGAWDILNMGRGSGISVLEMIANMEKVTGRSVPWKAAPRRAGDVAQVVANPAKANKVLGWTADKTVEQMCADAWRWKSDNPNGYSKKKSGAVSLVDLGR